MTGAEHFREGERVLAAAQDAMRTSEAAPAMAAVALAHFVAAQVAVSVSATALDHGIQP